MQVLPSRTRPQGEVAPGRGPAEAEAIGRGGHSGVVPPRVRPPPDKGCVASDLRMI